MNIDQAYAICRRIAHRYGANFSVGFRFLPRKKRRAVYAAYAFCRWADDIADVIPSEARDPLRKSEGDPSPSARLRTAQRLDEWQHELDRCYAGAPSHPI